MNIAKEQADKVIAALSMNRIMARDENGNYTKEITAQVVVEALSIMRGLAEDAEPVARLAVLPHGQVDIGWMGMYKPKHNDLLYTSPQAAQTAVKSEPSAQAAQALARPPSEGKTIEALAPTEAALRDVVRQSEDLGLYDADFQTEAQEREAFEAWASNDGAWTRAIERDGADYKLMQTSSNWRAWKAARARAGSKP